MENRQGQKIEKSIWRPKHVFITGAAGFIGGYIVREFVQQGWHVLALVHRRKSPDLEARAAAGAVTILQGDLADAERLKATLASALKGRQARLDAIVHCAGRASDVGREREFRSANYESVRHLVQIAKDLHAGRFVFISTTDVYGLRDFHGEDEDALDFDPKPVNPYPKFKIAAEKWIRRTLSSERFVILRPAAVWGVGDPTLTPRIVSFLRRSPWIVHFGRWRGRNRWPLAHVRNVAAASYLATVSPEAAGRAINVLDSEKTSIDEFYRALASVYLPKKKLRSVTLPLWMGELIGLPVSAISNLLNLDHPFADPSLYALHSVSSNLDFSNRRYGGLFARAQRVPVTRDEGVRELREAAYSNTQNSVPLFE